MTTNALMTQTLPTLVGMHVVSSSTKTLFGRGRGKTATRAGRKTAVRTFKGRVVHKGSRGGTYIVKKGRKIYL